MKMKLNEEEDLENFIHEQRRRIARERETLEQNPTSAVTDYIIDEDTKRQHMSLRQKEQVPPKPQLVQTTGKPPTPQFLKLGDSYQKQKEKLNDELKQEYRKALSEKQVRTTGIRSHYMTTYEQGLAANFDKTPRPDSNSDLGLSLPIKDRLSAKERLKLQRNKEYNRFKIDKENEEKMKRAAQGLSPRLLTTWATPIYLPNDPNLTTDNQSQAKNEKVNLGSYQELLDKKRREENNYRRDNVDEDNVKDKIIYREKPRRDLDYEDEPTYRRVRLPPKRSRPKYVMRYYDDDSIDDQDEEEEIIRRIRARRRKRMTQRFVDSGDEDDDELLEKNYPREVKEGRRRLNSAQSRTTGNKLTTAAAQNDLRSKSAPPDQEFTGLPIGHVPSANTVQRRKDEYKLDLQRQMEQNTLNKRREKEMELRVDASGANDPQSQNRIGDPSPRHQKHALKTQDEDTEPRSSKRKGKKKTSFRKASSESESEDEDRRRAPRLPRQPGGYYRPPALPNYYQPFVPPQYASPHDEAYYYYGSRNPLDPTSALGAPIAPLINHGAPPIAPPGVASYPGVSPMMAAMATRGSGPAQTNEPEQPQQSKSSILTGKRDKFESSLVADETRDSLKKKEKMAQYQEELRHQMAVKEREKTRAKLEQERYDQRKDEEAKNYNPWGKGGGGAPMKDKEGKLVSDLRQMHLENEDLVRDPTKLADVVKQRNQPEREGNPPDDRQQYDDQFFNQESTLHNELSPRFGRSNPFEQRETSHQKSQKDLYKEELQRQIDQRRKEEAARKEKLRLEDEKMERRMEEQNRKMQEEIEEEKRKQQKKIEEQRRKAEELQKAAEEKRQDEERKKKEERSKRDEERRQDIERERQERLQKTASPPIKSQELHGSENVAAQSTKAHVDTHRSDVRPPEPQRYQAPENPPVIYAPRGASPQPAPVRQSKSRDSKRVSRELSALRKQLLSEQRRIESQLRTSDVPLQFGAYQPTRLKPETLVDLSQTRQRPVQVRRPPTTDRPSSKALKEFSNFKHRSDDTASLKMFRLEHPETPDNSRALERQQEELIRSQLKKIETLRVGGGARDQPHFSGRKLSNDSRNGFTLIPPESRMSMLDADTSYIPVPEEDVDVRPPSSPMIRKTSARERRRRTKNGETDGGATYRAADTYSLNSLNSLATLDVDRLANKNQDRLDKLKELQGDEVSLTDPDDILDRFVNQHRPPDTPDSIPPPRRARKAASVTGVNERSPSVNTLDTELWMRPGTGPPDN